MHVTGDLAFPADAAFALTRADRLPTTGAPLTVARVDGAVTGAFPPVHVPGVGTWRLFVSGHDVKLGLVKGTVLMLR